MPMPYPPSSINRVLSTAVCRPKNLFPIWFGNMRPELFSQALLGQGKLVTPSSYPNKRTQ